MTKTERANLRAMSKGLETAMSWWSARSMDRPFTKREDRAFEGVKKLFLDARALLNAPR